MRFDCAAETECQLLVRSAFPVGRAVPGPLLVDDATATIYIPRGWDAERDPHDNLVLRHRTPVPARPPSPP